MPFVDVAAPAIATLQPSLGAGLAHDITTRLAKLRSVFVIGDGTMFALAERGIDAEDVGRRLNVDYVASGWRHLTWLPRDGAPHFVK